MILDMYSDALQKDLMNLPWLPIVVTIGKIVLYILVIIVIINHYFSLSKIKKEIIKIRQLLENNKNDVI